MELSFSFKTGNKKNKSTEKSTRVGSFGTIIHPEEMGNDWFYPLNFQDKAHAHALISMYEELPEIQAPVNYLIDKMAIINFNLIKITADGDELISDSDVMDLIKTPNQYMNKSDFIKSFFLNRVMLGVGYINRIIPIGYETPEQLYVLNSATTEVKVNEISKRDPRLNEISGYVTDWGNGEVNLSADEVVVQYEANLCAKVDEIRSRLISVIMASDSLRYNYEAAIKIYRDRGALGVLSPKESTASLTKEQADQMRDQYYEENGITGNKAPFMITPRAVSYTKVGFSVDELKLDENRLRDFTAICNVLNIDPALFDNTRATYNNKVLAKKNFWEDVGIPQFNAFLELLGKTVNLPENERFKADYSDIPALQEDYKTKVDANSTAYNDGAITQAEYRESIGFEGGEDSYKTEQGASTEGNQGQNE